MAFSMMKPEDFQGNVFDRIGKQWMLVTASDGEHYNTMTASWGGLGVLWNKNVAFIFVRPGRHTFGFVEKAERFTLSFYPESQRQALAFCGTKSGRDFDKAAQTGLTPHKGENGLVWFEQAEWVFGCRKLYAYDLDPACMLDASIAPDHYPLKDFHRMYIGEIETCLKQM